MKIEHLALQVPDPVGMAGWYVAHLGLTVRQRSDGPPWGHFLADDGGRVMLELFRFEDVPVPDYAAMPPRQLHLAFLADDVPAAADRLTQAGARVVGPPEVTPLGDTVAMLRDPWGFPVQLVKRKNALLDGN